MPPADASWSESALYACPCGTLFEVTRWRWVDVVARADLARRVAERGPYEGRCPKCSVAPRTFDTWLKIDARGPSAQLQIPPARRGRLLDELSEHIELVRRRGEAVAPWMLQPQWAFAPSDTTAVVEPTGSPAVVEPRPSQPLVELPLPAPVHVPAEASASKKVEGYPAGNAGVPQIIGSDVRSPTIVRPADLGAWVVDLELRDDDVWIVFEAGPDHEKWSRAKLEVRPIHVRDAEYPLCGVRIVAFHFGQRGCVDAFVDPGSTIATESFRHLSKRFEVTFEVVGGSSPTARRVTAEGLEPNAALCIESARGRLAQGEFPPESYTAARRWIEGQGVAERLAASTETISAGAYQHIIGAGEAKRALTALDRISDKDTLGRLLEVDGLAMGDYDAIRRRVLAGALEHGLVAPRRFWRRMVASGLVSSLEDYATQLSANRARHEGEEGDLEPTEALQAWEGILALCERKGMIPPPEIRSALGLNMRPTVPAAAPTSAVAGEIVPLSDGEDVGLHPVALRLANPATRLKAASDVLRGRVGGVELARVFDVFEELDTDELLALMPDLSDLGSTAVPHLVPKLQSPRREIRQAAAILLGMSRAPAALDALCQRLVSEPTTVWLDVARAVGAFGRGALPTLASVLTQGAVGSKEGVAIERVSRALAEVALSDGVRGPSHEAVAGLVDGPDSRLRTAARRALATLRDVSQSGAAIRGELPLSEETEIRGFARRAYEAITIPELEVEAEA